MTMMMLMTGMGDSGPKAILPATLNAVRTYPGSATLTLSSGGGWTTNGGSGTWLLRGLNSDFECRATGFSGSALASGVLNTWQSLSASRSWSLAASSSVEKACTFTLEIRRASDGVVVASAVVTIKTFTNL